MKSKGMILIKRESSNILLVFSFVYNFVLWLYGFKLFYV